MCRRTGTLTNWLRSREYAVKFPRWLAIQRLGLFLFLACGVLLLLYALGFITGVYLFYAYGDKGLGDFYREMQRINTLLLWRAVFFIVCALVLFLLELGNHAAGLFTLAAVLLIAAAGVFFSVHSLAILSVARRQYAALDFTSLNRYIERGTIQYRFSTFTWDLGLGIYALLLSVSLFTAIVVMRNAAVMNDSGSVKEV